MKKRIISVVLVLLMMSGVVVQQFAVSAASVTSWDWNNDGNFEAWTINEYINSATVAEGCFVLDVLEGDANATSPEVSFNAEQYSTLEITYKNSTEDTNAELFWTSSNGGWGAERGLGFSTIADGQWHTATIDLSQSEEWSGTITQVRFDPTEVGSGLFAIDSLRFIPTGEVMDAWNFSVNDNFEDWCSSEQMDSYEVKDGSMNMTVSGQFDPFFTNYSSSFDTSYYKKLVIVYKNDTDSNVAEFYWSRPGENWSTERGRSFSTVNDGEWHSVTIDLSTETNWTGTVNAFRFDPVGMATGTFKIDKIALGSANAVLHTDPMVATSEKSWNWANDGEMDGWTCHPNVEGVVADSNLALSCGDFNDPYIVSPEFSIDADIYDKIEITYRTNYTNNEGRIYWRTDDNEFTQVNSYGFTLQNSNDWERTVVDMSSVSNWTGDLSQIRFDFAESGSGSFVIDSFRVISSSGETTETTCTNKAANNISWDWQTNGDYLGWNFNQDVVNSDVREGTMIMAINGGIDPYVSSPEVAIDASRYKIIEIKYKNEAGVGNSQIFWTNNFGDMVSGYNQSIVTIADGKWHTLRLDMTDNSNWKGIIKQFRLDPLSGGVGNFYIDRIVFMDAPSRYTMSNGYIYLSGVNGAVDTLKFDPDGTGAYGENMLMGNLYMGLKYDGTAYTSAGSDVNWTIKDNTLTIHNIKIADGKLIGKWVLSLNGNKLNNTFTLNSEMGSDATLETLGYCYDMVWENEGFEVEADPGLLRVPFSKMVSSDDRYHSVYAFKRMPSVEDPDTIGFTGSWLDLEGANGYDYNLRFSFDTGYVSPICNVDYLKMQFRGRNSSVSIGAGASLTRSLGIEVSHNGDITPEHFTSFESSGDPEFAEAVSEMLHEFGNAREIACTNPDWAEFISTIRCWQDDNYIELEKNKISDCYQHPNGYVNTWGDLEGWPFPEDRDSNHYITTAANLINAVYNYYVYDGDEAFFDHNLPRLRLAVDYLLSQFDENYGVFKIDHPDHDGTNKSVGSNYWDITPYGHLSAYDNIYGYLAVTKMVEIERILGNTSRAEELENYANAIKAGYNELFWAGDHYIQCIDVHNVRHDYGAVYLNLEAITYGLADEDRAAVILDWISNTPTSTGQADVFSRFIFAPRATMFDNPGRDFGGWHALTWPGGEEYGTEQIQNGGTIFYTAYYEMMSRVKAYGGDNAYARLKEVVDRFNMEHLQGGTLITGDLNQHFTSGLVGCWGEFPENGLVAVSVKNGIMGIDADMDGLNVTPAMPSDLSDLTLNQVNFRDMLLDITTTATSVRIKARENNNKYTDWVINGERVSGLFDVTVDISEGETVSLYRDAEAYKTYTVTFDAGENGALSGETEITVYTGTDLSTVTFPTVKANVGYLFTGWSQTEGTITSDITVTAQYEAGYEIGDVDRNGQVNILDVTEIQKKLARLTTFDEEQTALADVDGNGIVSIKDVTYVQMYIVKIIEALPVK